MAQKLELSASGDLIVIADNFKVGLDEKTQFQGQFHCDADVVARLYAKSINSGVRRVIKNIAGRYDYEVCSDNEIVSKLYDEISALKSELEKERNKRFVIRIF